MEMFQSSGFVALIIFILNVVFISGFWFWRVKNAVSKEEVINIVSEEVEKQLANHCPFNRDITDLLDWKVAHTKWGEEQNKMNHEKLDEIAFNLKSLCKHLDIDYIKRNGS
jgi:hypothetical protein